MDTSRETKKRPGSLPEWVAPLVAPFAVLMLVAATACSGSRPVSTPETGAGARPEATKTASAKQNGELGTIRSQLQEAEQGLARLRSDAKEASPVADARLQELTGKLQSRIAEAEKRAQAVQPGSTGAAEAITQLDAAVGTIRDLRQQAEQRIGELRSQEQQKREQLRAEAERNRSGEAGAPGDLLRGLDGQEYPVYSHDAVERVQRGLKELGFYRGEVNGRLDASTMVAIGRFQQEQDLHVSGVPSPSTRARLMARASTAANAPSGS